MAPGSSRAQQKTAFLFPGQGAQKVGMGQDFHAAYSVARETFAEAARVLGWDVAARCFRGPQEELNRTAVCQPAILTVSIAIFRVLQEKLPALSRSCGAAAGLSLGEYSALVVAGALDFADALRLVQKRGEFMERTCREHQGTMVSVIGLSADDVRAACDEAGGGKVVAANFNCPGQVVISGAAEAVQSVAAACVARGAKRTVPLSVAGAFHSPFMQSAAVRLQTELAGVPFRAAAFPIVSNVTAAYVREPGEFRSCLVSQITGPVLWQQSMERLLGDGFNCFIEVGPGNVLSGLMRRIAPQAEIINVAAMEALAGLKAQYGVC